MGGAGGLGEGLGDVEGLGGEEDDVSGHPAALI